MSSNDDNNNNKNNGKEDDAFSSLNGVDDEDLEDNYYSMLNVTKEATDKEITQAYHRLGLIYHPDKHKEHESKRNAEMLFAKIKRAYDVLINPHKRAIYDSVGVKGLKQDDLQLVVKSKTPQEIREEYERLSKEREERRIEKLTHSQGHFTMQVDTTRLFDSVPAHQHQFQRNKMVKIGNFEMQQIVDFPLTNKDSITIGGKLNTNENYGTGNVFASYRRIMSPNSYFDLKTTIGSLNKFSIGIYKRLTQRCSATLKGVFKYKNGSLTPVLWATFNYQLDTNLVGQLEFKNEISDRSDAFSSLSTSLNYENANYQANLRFQLSPVNTYLNVSLVRNFINYDFRLKTSVQYGFVGASLSYGIEKQITKFSKVTASMILNSMAGVILNFEIVRGSQMFIVPVHLSHEIAPSAIFYGSVAPLAIYYVVKKLIIDPYQREVEEVEAKKKQEKLKNEINEKRHLALAAQTLMRETVARIIEKESPSGLIIKKAVYGKLINKERALFDNEKLVDVQIPLQFLVKEHSLQLLSDQSKSNLEGFYDPCLGESKSLYIEYDYNGEAHRCTIEDNEILRLPKASHKLSWWSRN